MKNEDLRKIYQKAYAESMKPVYPTYAALQAAEPLAIDAGIAAVLQSLNKEGNNGNQPKVA